MSQILGPMNKDIFYDPFAPSYEPSVTHEKAALMEYINKKPKYDSPKIKIDYLDRVHSLNYTSPPQLTRSNPTTFTRDMYNSKTSLVEIGQANTSKGKFYSSLTNSY